MPKGQPNKNDSFLCRFKRIEQKLDIPSELRRQSPVSPRKPKKRAKVGAVKC